MTRTALQVLPSADPQPEPLIPRSLLGMAAAAFFMVLSVGTFYRYKALAQQQGYWPPD